MPSRSHTDIYEACRAAGFKDRRAAGLHIKASLSAGIPARDLAHKMGLTIEEARKLAVKAIEEPRQRRTRGTA
jgi:hypothetical protein